MTRRLVRVRLLAAPAMLPVLLLMAGAGCAAHSDTAALQQEIGNLKGTIEHLNARIEHLEGQSSSPPGSASQAAVASPPQAAAAPVGEERPSVLRERWRKIAYGMTFEQVDAILGRPQGRIDESPKTIWYYSYPDVGSGSIIFVQESGVTDWQAPPFGNFAYWP